MNTTRSVGSLVLGFALVLAACAGAPPPSEAPARQFSQVELQYLTEVTRVVGENVQYPNRAYEAGESGTAMVRVVVARDGSILSTTLVGKSGSDSIDDEAVELFNRIHRVPAMPANLYPGADKAAFELPITYNRSGMATDSGLRVRHGMPPTYVTNADSN